MSGANYGRCPRCAAKPGAPCMTARGRPTKPHANRPQLRSPVGADGGIRSRVKELRSIPASQLKKNGRNWRLHPEAQQGALGAMLAEVGFAGAILARETDEGLEVIDGHLRRDLAGDAEVPVLVTDLTEDEARQVLATYDPIGAMAKADAEAFRAAIDGVELVDHAEIRNLVAKLEGERPDVAKIADDLDKEYRHTVPGMKLQPHEHYDFLVVMASNTHDWNRLCDVLDLEPEKVGRSRKVGTCRAIRADKLLEKLER